MIRLPELNKKNWKKILRELDISKFPSLPIYVASLRQKLLNKEQLVYSETQLGYARFNKYFQEYTAEINALYIETIDYSKFDSRPPLPWQKPAIEFLLKNNRCILGDDMGVGKTGSTIFACLSMEDKHKILIITKKTLKYNFAKELSFYDDRISIIDKKWVDNKFVIVNYDSVHKFQADIISSDFSIIVCDEAHELTNLKTKKGKSIQEIITKLKPLKLWFLTGTPIGNKPLNYYSLLKLIKHPVAKNWVNFVQRYCNAVQNFYGQWETGGASNLEELHRLTQDVFLRRLKTNIGMDMPDKVRTPVFYELKNTKGYNNCIDAYTTKKLEEIREEFGVIEGFENYETKEITQLLLRRQFCAISKIDEGITTELIDTKLEEDETNKIIVFTNFTAVIDKLSEYYGKEISCIIDGRILKPEERLRICDEFNENPSKRLIFINIKAGATGLNLTGANKEIINDMDWVPNNMLQAEDRAWRYGQKRDVEVTYPLYDKTVETILYNVVESKMKIISTVIEGKEESYFKENKNIEYTKTDNRNAILQEIFKQMGL